MALRLAALTLALADMAVALTLSQARGRTTEASMTRESGDDDDDDEVVVELGPKHHLLLRAGTLPRCRAPRWMPLSGS